MAKRINDNIEIANATLMFRNFSGKGGQYNQAGKRNFCVLLDTDVANQLIQDGWNVRWLQPRDEGDAPQAYLNVAVEFKNWPPQVFLISSNGKSVLNEDTVNILDWAEIQTADLILRPYNWTMHEGTPNETTGVKAYLKSLYVTIYEDTFAKKYADAPDAAQDSIGGCGNCDACDGTCDHAAITGHAL